MSSNSNNSQIERMKSLMTYGLVNESAKNKKGVSGNIEYTAKGADGKSYAIVRECTKYYIKSAPAGANSVLAENYDYLGGYMNRKSHEYSSYNQAMKNFEMKLRSVNEACGGKVNTEFTNPDRKPDMIQESTAAMSKDLLRTRQIIANAAAINEGRECQFCGKEDREDELKKTSEKPAKSGEPFVDPAKAEMETPVAKTSKSPEKSGAPYDEKAQVKKMQQVAESCNLKEDNEDVDGSEDDETPEIEGDETPENETHTENDDNMPSLADDPEDADDTDDDEEADDDIDDIDDDDDIDEDEDEDDDLGNESKEELIARIEKLEKRLADLEGNEVGDDDDEYNLDMEDSDEEPEDDFSGDEDEDEYDSYDDLPDEVKDVTEPMIESIVRSYRKPLRENELHEFGNHPSYRKQPMSVPSNSDMSRNTKDFDDESVKGSKPFGSSKGNGFPYGEKYNRLVDNTTDIVMETLRKLAKK